MFESKQQKLEARLTKALDQEYELLLNLQEKQNPVQPLIAQEESDRINIPFRRDVQIAYENHETIQRGVNLLVDSLAGVDFDIKEPKDPNNVETIRIDAQHLRQAGPEDRRQKDRRVSPSKLIKLLNYQPNPFQDKLSVLGNLWLDYILKGNAFLHYDGDSLYYLDASEMEIRPHKKRYIESYVYGGGSGNDSRFRLRAGEYNFAPNEIIHIKAPHSSSQYVGMSLLYAALKTAGIMTAMTEFQQSFFKNGTVLGILLKSPNVLSPKVKAKILRNWRVTYNPRTGGRSATILDAGLEVDTVGIQNYKELDFDAGYNSRETRVLKLLGVPPILLDSGNNANVRPNMRLFYELTVLPTLDRFVKALEVFFGYDIQPVTLKIPALQPELKEKASYVATLVNNGLMTPDEGRLELRLPPIGDEASNQLRIPQNITGSATQPNQGGRPPSDEDD